MGGLGLRIAVLRVRFWPSFGEGRSHGRAVMVFIWAGGRAVVNAGNKNIGVKDETQSFV